jgi:DNA-binding Lrp family transcriptional regulator
MKTILELSRELGVSTSTIHRRLKGAEVSYTVINSGRMYVNDEGVEYLKNAVSVNFSETHCVSVKPNEIHVTSDDEILFLREQVNILQEQLNLERAHSREMAEEIAQIMKNQQHLAGMDKTIPLLAEKKKGWFRFMRRKDKE